MSLILFDLLLVVLGTARLTRFVTTDSLGQWWLHKPLYKAAYGRGEGAVPPRWAKYAEGIECGFCSGYWLGVIVLASLWVFGGPGDVPDWWRYGAGTFALSYVVGHASSRLD